jgi:diguanylate cyclase (GGDEF)-like protein
MDRPTSEPRDRGRGHGLVAATALAALIGLAAAALAQNQAGARDDLAARFHNRGAVGARFVETFAAQLLDRERLLASHQLGGNVTDPSRFQDLADAFGFQAAVLLDAAGRALHVAPANPQLVGQSLAGRYDHLRAGVAGTPAVSDVVPSAVRSVPVVAFAAPYDTPSGRRVFSGAYEISDTPLGEFLRAALPITPHRVLLVDSKGVIVAGDPPLGDATVALADTEPGLSQVLARRKAGEYHDSTSSEYYFSAHQVSQTPWTLVIAAPSSLLFAPVSGTRQLVPWLILGLLALVGALALALLVRYVNGRAELAALNLELEYISRTDPVTGLYNRRHLDEHFGLASSAARRHHQPLSILVIDIDHFKIVNDTYGHDTGDVVLRAVAERMQGHFRAEDILGRWGGEEFLAVLPMTDLPGAAIAGDRLRAAVAASPVMSPTGTPINVTVSIGCASDVEPDPAELLQRADAALYRAKDAGRNCVVTTAEVD